MVGGQKRHEWVQVTPGVFHIARQICHDIVIKAGDGPPNPIRSSRRVRDYGKSS